MTCYPEKSSTVRYHSADLPDPRPRSYTYLCVSIRFATHNPDR